ncbi:nuclear transport factor 2 family protein [Streptomyces sp. NPDC013161]|uniref:nuclear transport factor 2 family protein n=1 Tax=Streptomyces sp. NPDC013161 TaxID=3364862 RepID=UPI003680AA51
MSDIPSGTPSAVDLLRRSLDAFLAKDMKAWTDLCADDVVAEFPFAPEGAPARIEGREALYEYLRGYPDVIDVREIPSVRVYATADENVAIAEWSVIGSVVSNGNPYNMSYATFVTFRDGLVVNYREYWNPKVFLEALGGGGF